MRRVLILGIILVVLSLLFGCGRGNEVIESAAPNELVIKDDIVFHSPSALADPFVDPTPGDKWTWDLIAGQNMLAGTVSIWNDGVNIYVEFDMLPAWPITESHVYVGQELPKVNGNPGGFQYKDDHDPAVTHFLLTVPMDDDWDAKEMLYIAVHAVSGSETIWGGRWNGGDPTYQYNWKKWGGYFSWYPAPMPDLPGGWVEYKGYHYGSFSYWNIVFTDQGLIMPPGDFTTNKGITWVGWCVDKIHNMRANNPYMVQLYSTYDTSIPTGHSMPINSNGNWDFVNFMINERRNPTADANNPFYNWPSGTPVNWGTTTGKNSFQNAVWYFTNNIAIGAGSHSEAMINYVIANGDNYIPEAGDWYAVALYPDTSTGNITIRAQYNIIEVDP